MTPRFCPYCAGTLEWRRLEDERHPHPVCTQCGRVSWRNPKPTASGLITRREGGSIDVLLVRRAKEPYLGHWDCPGGFIDPDEHPEDAVRRELLEELGLRVDVTRFVGIFMDRYGEEDGESTLNVYYEVAIRGGVIAPASDVSEAAWFPLDRLPEPIAFENSRQALRALQAAG